MRTKSICLLDADICPPETALDRSHHIQMRKPNRGAFFLKEHFRILDPLAYYPWYMVQRLYLLSIVHVKASEETDIKGEKEDRQSFRTADRRNDGIICCLAV